MGKIIKWIVGREVINYFKYLNSRKSLIKILKRKFYSKKQKQSPGKVAIIFIGTNKYINFFPNFYDSLKKYFLPETRKDFFVFTDMINFPFLIGKEDVVITEVKNKNWLFSTLLRFEFINMRREELKEYSHIIFIDADMYANSYITEWEFFSHNKPLFGVIHPLFVNNLFNGIPSDSFEFNKKSLAAVDKSDNLSIYYQGCFWGGKSENVLRMSEELAMRIKEDFKNKVVAKFHDESHLNKYFIERKKSVHAYAPNYAYPKKNPIPKGFIKKIIHSDKTYKIKEDLTHKF